MTASRRFLLLSGAATLAATLVLGALLYRTARGSSGAAATSTRSRADAPLPVIWSRSETWPRRLRPVLRRHVVRLRDLRGFPVVLNFFASWCDPCRQEAALLRDASRRADARVVFLGADVHDYAPDARRFLRAHAVPYAAIRPGSSIIRGFGLIGLPETFYLGRDGRVRAVTRGQLTAHALARGLRRVGIR